MTPKDVKALAVPFIFVDCRSKEERDVSKIDPEALSIEEFEEQLNNNSSSIDQGVIIICHCTVGIRSARFASKHQNSIEKIYTMPGGILSWVDEGYPVYEGKGTSTPIVKTKAIHVCLKEFLDLAPEGYDCVYTNQQEQQHKKSNRFHWPAFGSWLFVTKRSVAA